MLTSNPPQNTTTTAKISQSRQPNEPKDAENGISNHRGGRGRMRQLSTVYSASMTGLDINRASRSGAIDFDCLMERHYG